VIDVNSAFLTSGGNIAFNAPPPPPGTYVFGTFYNGLIANLQITLKNDSVYTMTGFDLKLINAVPTQMPDTNDVTGHPDNYAHFHDVDPTTFGTNETLSLLTPNDLGGAFGPEGSSIPPPSEIIAVGDVANGASVTGSGMKLHEEEDPGRNNSFSLNISASAAPVVDVHSDILWQNTSGQASIWEMDGTNQIPGGSALVGGNPGPSWKVVGTGDFNDDGHSDILWQNADGQASIWEMDGTNQIPDGSQLVGGNPGPNWRAVNA
jgi:uncharacterized protein YbdZ (MbtH family)